MAKFQFKFKLDSYLPHSHLNTKNLFDTNYKEPSLPAIDTFFGKTKELNQLIKKTEDCTGALPGLVLLGYVSAVESYFREIIRRLIFVDQASGKACEEQMLTYGAVVVHEKTEMLPEALLENRSFANKKGIRDSMRDFLGIKGDIPPDVTEVLDDFSSVCQLRHCIVHRFGKLGSNNAIKLGLMAHKKCLEKPLILGFENLQEIFLICNNTVKVINNFLFQRILSRTVDFPTCKWNWDLRKDKRDFKKYYDIFVSKSHKFGIKEIYHAFKRDYKNSAIRMPKVTEKKVK